MTNWIEEAKKRVSWYWPRIEKANTFAAWCHEGQFRKWGNNVPYIEHPERVAWRVSRLPIGEYDEDTLVAALLHDTIEDCGIWDTTISNLFGAHVSAFVSDLTNQSKLVLGTKSTRAERKDYDIKRLKIMCDEVKRVKYCDRIENLLDTLVYDGTPADWALKYADETLLLNDALHGASDVLEAKLLELVENVKEHYGSLANTH